MAKRAKSGGAAKAVPLPLSDFDEARGRWRSEVQAGLGGKANPQQPLRHRGQAALHARGLAGDAGGERYMAGAGLPRPAADDARHLPDHAPRPHLDAAPADRARRAGGLQRAAQDHPGARRHGRLADPLQLGLSRLRRRRGAARDPRHLRRDGELGRGHGRLPRRHSRSATSRPRSTIPRRSRCWRWSWRSPRAAASPGSASPAPPTSRTTSRTSSPTTCSSGWRCRARGACCSTTSPSARQHLPQWNPLSIVGQHMQQAGATPAEAMGLTLSSAIQYAGDCLARGWDPDQFLPRFTFFFDISISFFEEVAKFRAGRRIWARARARALRRQGRALVALQVPRPDLGRGPDARAAAQQHRPRDGAGDGRHLRRAAVAAHGCLRRGAVGADREGGAHRRADAEHPQGGGAPDRRDRSAGRLLLRGGADRPDGGARSAR